MEASLDIPVDISVDSQDVPMGSTQANADDIQVDSPPPAPPAFIPPAPAPATLPDQPEERSGNPGSEISNESFFGDAADLLSRFHLKPRHACKPCRARKEVCEYGAAPPIITVTAQPSPPSQLSSPFDSLPRHPDSDNDALAQELNLLGKEVEELLSKFEQKTGEVLDVEGLQRHVATPTAAEGPLATSQDVSAPAASTSKGKHRNTETSPMQATWKATNSVIEGAMLPPKSTTSLASLLNPISTSRSPAPRRTFPALVPPNRNYNSLPPPAAYTVPSTVAQTLQFPFAPPGPSAPLATHQLYQRSLSAASPFHPSVAQTLYPSVLSDSNTHPPAQFHPRPQALAQHRPQHEQYLSLMSQLPPELQQGLPRGMKSHGEEKSKKRKRPEPSKSGETSSGLIRWKGQ